MSRTAASPCARFRFPPSWMPTTSARRWKASRRALPRSVGCDPEENAVIERSLAAGDKLLERGSFEAGDLTIYRGINGDFHDTLLAAARNRMLGEMIRICHHVPMSSSRNIVAFEYRDVRRRHDDHHRIHEAIIAREPWRAELLMREHVSSIKASLIRALAERNAGHPGETHPADFAVVR